jgi:hypothetical protein
MQRSSNGDEPALEEKLPDRGLTLPESETMPIIKKDHYLIVIIFRARNRYTCIMGKSGPASVTSFHVLTRVYRLTTPML